MKKILFTAGFCVLSLAANALTYIGSIDKSANTVGNCFGETETPAPVAFYSNPSDVVLAYAQNCDRSITFYKSDLSVNNRILCNSIPNFMGFGYIENQVNGNFYVSQHLFNDDDKLEFIVWVMTNGYRYQFCVYNEDMECLFTSYERFSTTQKFTLYPTSAGYLLSVGNDTGTPFYYALSDYQVETSVKTVSLPASVAYPNPAGETITLPYKLAQGTSVMNIYSIDGQLIESRQIDSLSGGILLNVSGYAPGIYLYEANGESNRFIVK